MYFIKLLYNYLYYIIQLLYQYCVVQYCFTPRFHTEVSLGGPLRGPHAVLQVEIYMIWRVTNTIVSK